MGDTTNSAPNLRLKVFTRGRLPIIVAPLLAMELFFPYVLQFGKQHSLLPTQAY